MNYEIERIIKKLSSVPTDYIFLYLHKLKLLLSKRQYKIVKLKLDDYKNVEIANILGVCPATVTNDLKKIREVVYNDARLRKLLCLRKKQLSPDEEK